MSRRILISALALLLVQTSPPVSASAEQPAPAQDEQTKSTTSAQLHIYPDLPQVQRTWDLQSATGALILTGPTPRQYSRPLQQTLRQATSGGGGLSHSRQRLLVVGILAGVALGIYALETRAPKANDARCSSANPQFCN